MLFFGLSPKQTLRLLLPVNFFLWSLALADPTDSTDDDYPDSIYDGSEPESECLLDAPEWSSAGLGVEFETRSIKLSSDCDKAKTYPSKGKRMNQRLDDDWKQGENWDLTVDTSELRGGVLFPEYILDGVNIELGTSMAVDAATAVKNDIISWNPSSDMQDNKVQVDGSPCNPWSIIAPKTPLGSDATWSPQLTAPMPLEGINELFSIAVSDPPKPSKLVPLADTRRKHNVKFMIHVTKEFFQASPNGITPDTVTEDVLGFFSILISYIKGARRFYDDQSPKMLISIMPRTGFAALYEQVRDRIPGRLYDVVKMVSCYRNEGGVVRFDVFFCTNPSAPQPNGSLNRLAFEVSSSGKKRRCTIAEWIESIQDGAVPDKLSWADEIIDKSIGGLKSKLEYAYGTRRAVPLFEFRQLDTVTTDEMPGFVGDAEREIVEMHKKYAVRPAVPEGGDGLAVRSERVRGSVFVG